jgi:hypothetical protein
MLWKFLENSDVANMLNYLAKPFYTDNSSEFYGFIPLNKDSYCSWGLLVEGEVICAVHLLGVKPNCVGDNPTKEQKLIDIGLEYVVMFYGTDNCSYLVRFNNKSTALMYLDSLQVFDVDSEPCAVYYNS